MKNLFVLAIFSWMHQAFASQAIAQNTAPPAVGSPDARFKQLDENGDGMLTAGDHTRTLRVGDLVRRYRIHIPKKYDPSKATPVVVVFHGGGGNPESMIRLTGMNAKSDEEGFLVVYPFGVGQLANTLLTFNGGDQSCN